MRKLSDTTLMFLVASAYGAAMFLGLRFLFSR